jgi:hypothetical protein|nr:MAG TPA: hypothetical protein [Caudoviricetes sp.]
MRRLLSLVIELLVCLACVALEPQEIAIDTLSMSFGTQTEQIHSLYGAGDFVINKDATDCAPMLVEHSVSVREGKLSIDAGSEDELSFKVTSCSYEVGKVFADRGDVDVYRLVCQELDDNVPSKLVITIQKAKDGARTETIVTIPRYDEYGVLSSIMILH